jgi:hypothetical protein
MKPEILLIILAGIPAVLAALLSFVGVLLNLANHKRISNIEVHINGHIDKILGAALKLKEPE